MTLAYVGVGSNLGDPVQQVRAAIAEMDQLPDSRLMETSSLYRTAPVGYAGQPDFINAVARLETALPADQLLDQLQALEARHGRSRPFPNAPRLLDLDLLLYGDLQVRSNRLTVPHPRLHERAFVLQPLLELDPELRIPGLGALATWLPATAGQRAERID